jgi:hypothetical protein
MSLDRSIPCFPELINWPTPPVQPLSVANHGWYRDSGVQGGTYYVDLVDANGVRFPFFFDRFLGRLCYGASYETGDDAAFLRPGSQIELEAFQAIYTIASDSPQYAELLSKIQHARTWTAQV